MDMDMIRKHLYIFSFRFVTKFVIGIFVIVLPLFAVLKLMWQPKNYMYNFYAYDKGAFDVQIFGSSHSFCSVIPAVLYEDYGITSYDLGGVSQYMPMTYYYVKESINKNKPKVAAIEVYALYSDVESQHWKTVSNMSFRPMAPSINKINAIIDCKPEFLLASFVNYPISHSDFKGMTSQDYLLEREYDRCLGYTGFDKVYEHENRIIAESEYIDILTPIAKEEEEALRKTIELCLDNNIEPVLFIAPYPKFSSEKLRKYNYINEIAEEYGIEFLESCRIMGDIGIDFAEDFSDEHGHLNYFGAEKFTKYFGEWLVSNLHTSLDDHRYDEKKSKKPDWNEVVGDWHATKIRCELNHTENLQEYVSVLESTNAPYFTLKSDDDYEAVLKNELEKMSLKERKNVLYQVGAKIDRERDEIEGESIVYLVYNKYDVDEISIKGFPLR